MTKIMKQRWDKNRNALKKHLQSRKDINTFEYLDLVKMTMTYIFNNEEGLPDYEKLDIDNITVINDGDYQGTLLFVIPFKTYQPGANDYIITFSYYGSCSGCDSLLNIQDWHKEGEPATKEQLHDLMILCKDIACNAIKPFNYGWRQDKNWLPVEDELDG